MKASQTCQSLSYPIIQLLLIISLCILPYIQVIAQKSPRSLKKAVTILVKECPDSVKSLIIETEDKDMKEVYYPWGSYKGLENWLDNDKKTRLSKYLSKKGVSRHQEIVILIAFKKVLTKGLFNEDSVLAPYIAIEKKWSNEDRQRFDIDTLRGIYIPSNLNDCIRVLNTFFPDSTKEKIRQMSEDDFSGRLHLSLGMWMRNNWQLWGGSRLSKYFNDTGIYHPDDMSGIILDSYHRSVHGKSARLDEQIAFYKKYWAEAKEQTRKRKEEEFDEYKVGDTVYYNYKDGFVSKKQEASYDDLSCESIGLVVDKSNHSLSLKVLLLEGCDRKGVQYFGRKKSKKVLKRVKKGEHIWLDYSYWELY